MMPVAPDTLLEQLRWRYAVKRFDPNRAIPAPTWAALEQAVTLAPSSYGVQPWKFLVIDDPGLRQQLRPFAWDQPQITEAARLVVFCARNPPIEADVDRYLANMAAVRGQTVEALAGLRAAIVGKVIRPGFDGSTWAAKQVYLALGVFLIAAAAMGIDACPMEGFQPAEFDRILGLGSQRLTSVVLATAGYRSSDDKYATAAKVRYDVSDVIEHR
jgi:nitroreductase